MNALLITAIEDWFHGNALYLDGAYWDRFDRDVRTAWSDFITANFDHPSFEALARARVQWPKQTAPRIAHILRRRSWWWLEASQRKRDLHFILEHQLRLGAAPRLLEAVEHTCAGRSIRLEYKPMSDADVAQLAQVVRERLTTMLAYI